MKRFAGFMLVIVGVSFGVYVGVWLCFIGGIVQIVDAIKTTPVEGLDIAIGILRIIFAAAAGWLSGFIAVMPGVAMLK